MKLVVKKWIIVLLVFMAIAFIFALVYDKTSVSVYFYMLLNMVCLLYLIKIANLCAKCCTYSSREIIDDSDVGKEAPNHGQYKAVKYDKKTCEYQYLSYIFNIPHDALIWRMDNPQSRRSAEEFISTLISENRDMEEIISYLTKKGNFKSEIGRFFDDDLSYYHVFLIKCDDDAIYVLIRKSEEI